MSLPSLNRIRAALPQAQISVASSGWCADIYRICDAVDDVLDLPAKGRVLEELKFSNWIRTMNFDSAVILPNSFHSAIIPAVSGIKLRFAYNTDGRGFLLSDAVNKPRQQKHTVLYYQELLEVLGIPWLDGEAEFSLNIPDQVKSESNNILKNNGFKAGSPIIGFSPGAAWGPSKRWPAPHFRSVVDQLTRNNRCQALLFGSPGDGELTAEIGKGLGDRIVDLAGKFDNLHHLVAAIKKCDLLVTNDSGPMHIAAAVGTPVVALFGPTDEKISGPWVGSSGKATILRPENCSPCYNSQCRKSGDICLASISPEQCLDAAENLLATFAKQGKQS